MKMPKKIVWLAAMVIFAGLLLLLLLHGRQSSFGKRDTGFAVAAGSEITRIEMAQGDERVVLNNDGTGWFVNNGGETRKSAVNFLLQTLREIAIKSPVSDEHFDKEVLEKGIVPVRVKIWSRNRMINSFLVYKTESNIYGNIMRRTARTKPFIVSIPGFEGAIGSNFNMNELFWMPFNVFSYIPGDIASVKVDYQANPEESFTVYNSSLMGSDTLEEPVNDGFDNTKIKRYLSYFTWVPFESWAFDLEEAVADSITATVPMAKIIVSLSGGDSGILTIWEKTLTVDGELVTDTDRAWGRRDDGKLFLVRYFDIDPLLRRKSYFLAEE
jgi:hypothetical protein